MKISLRWIIVVCLTMVPISSFASCLDARLTGVNLAGAEFGSKLPGKAFKDYVYPNAAELTSIADHGANVIRLPFRWERLQYQALGPLEAGELKLIQDTVDLAKSKGICVILDVHNYGKYYSDSLATSPALKDAFVDLWLKLAVVFNDPDATVFGLMNEPVHIPVDQWAALGKRTLAALRSANSTNWVLLAGGRWSGAHDWFTGIGNLQNAIAFADVSDPIHRTAIEVHQYADSDFSGTHTECRPAAYFDPIFTKIRDWAIQNNQQLFLGEFGTPQNEICLNTLAHFLDLMNNNTWKGWTYWAAGSWWGNYPMAISTQPNVNSPQWPILDAHFYDNAPQEALSPPNPPST